VRILTSCIYEGVWIGIFKNISFMPIPSDVIVDDPKQIAIGFIP